MEPEAATQALINAANMAGGTDNISVILARVGNAPSREIGTAPMAAVTAPYSSVSAHTAPTTAVSATPMNRAPTARQRIEARRSSRLDNGSRGWVGTAGSAVTGFILGIVLVVAGFLAWNNVVASERTLQPSIGSEADVPAVIPTFTAGSLLTPTLTIGTDAGGAPAPESTPPPNTPVIP